MWAEEYDGNVSVFTSSNNAEVSIMHNPSGDTVELSTDRWTWASTDLLELSAFLLIKAQELAAKEKA